MLLLILWRYWRHWIQIWSPISGCESRLQPFLSAPVQLANVGYADELSRIGVWKCTAVVGGYHSWTTKGVTDLKRWSVKILKHEKSGKPISIQVDLLFFGKVNIAAVTDSGYKLLLEKHNNPVKKNRNFVQNHKLFEIFWKI